MREVNRPRFYVPPDVAEGHDGIREGLRWLLRWINEHPGTPVPLIIAPSLNQLRTIDLLEAACSTMQCESARTWRARPGRRNGPVLLLFPDRALLGDLDEWSQSALCVVPSRLEPIDYWVRARGAVDATGRSPGPGERAELVSNPVVREALDDLSVFVNKAHLVNYEDRAMAVRVLQTLYRNREEFEPTEVHAWALADRWSADAASRLREIAEGVVAGRSFRLRSPVKPRSGAIRSWRAAAKQRTG